MDSFKVIEALSALAQETRLAAFRLLVTAGHAGLPAGAIATRLETPHNTLSTHLAALQRAGLISSTRDGRRIIYHVDFEQARSVLEYLIADCCAGDRSLARAAIGSTFSDCCSGESARRPS